MRNATWRALEDLLDEGKIKHIGVSNYSKRHLQELLGSCRNKPFVNQVELHPCLQQKDLAAYCREQGIKLQAFGSLGGGDMGAPLLQNPTVALIARDVEKTPAQVLLKWGLQKGFSVLPKSCEKTRIESNMNLDFDLKAEHMTQLDSMEQGTRYTWKGIDPDTVK